MFDFDLFPLHPHADSDVSSMPAPVQEDGDVANSDAVLAGVCNIIITVYTLYILWFPLSMYVEVKVDHVSTHVPARFSDREMESGA